MLFCRIPCKIDIFANWLNVISRILNILLTMPPKKVRKMIKTVGKKANCESVVDSVESVKGILHDDEFDLLEVEVDNLQNIQGIDELMTQQTKLMDKVQKMSNAVNNLIARLERADSVDNGDQLPLDLSVDLNDLQKHMDDIKTEENIEQAVAIYEHMAKYVSVIKQQIEKKDMIIKRCN